MKFLFWVTAGIAVAALLVVLLRTDPEPALPTDSKGPVTRAFSERVEAFLDPAEGFGEERSVAELLAGLRMYWKEGLARGSRGVFYGRHGNAIYPLQELLNYRFEATRAICDEVDDLVAAGEGSSRYAQALCRALGFVKDPDAIPWLEESLLEESLLEEDRRELAEYCLQGWRRALRGAWRVDSRWVEEPESWSDFFIQRFSSETDAERRVVHLRAMQGWLHDSRTRSFFEKTFEQLAIGTEESLVAALYLYQHGHSIEREYILETVERLAGTEEGRELLCDYAEEIRHPGFVPFLVSLLESEWDWSIDRTLNGITFQLEVPDAEGWRRWYEENEHLSRREWAAQAGAELLQQYERFPSEANATHEDAVFRWQDPLFHPVFMALADDPDLHERLAGWVDLTYRPYWRPVLEEVVQRISADGAERVGAPPRSLSQRSEFRPGKLATWPEYVWMSNSRL